MRESPILSNYEILNQIGRGSYATVYKAINKKTADICAIKKISSYASDYNNLMTEIGIISNSKCKNIVRFLDSDYSNKEVSIVMEYCCGGSVKDVMRQLKRTMNQEQIAVIVRDVLTGLDYLHESKKIHRDVKAANILLNQDGVAKLGDFGVSEPLDSVNTKQGIIGTLLWLPPEVINKEPYSKAVDIWSLGITIIEMGDGEPPYQELAKEPALALKRIASSDIPSPTFRNPECWSNEMNRFLSLCLNKDSSRRRSARDLLNCDVIKKAPSNSVIKSLVDEVCSKSLRSVELESSLCKEFEYLLSEVHRLFRIYKERRMKVIRVDQMTDRLNMASREFQELQDRMAQRNDQASKMLTELNRHIEENQRLEREKDHLIATLDKAKKRKFEINDQLEKIRRNLISPSERRE